jgi:hypothetical protein
MDKVKLVLPVPKRDILEDVILRVKNGLQDGDQTYLSEIADRIRDENPRIPEFLYANKGVKPLFSAGVYEVLRLSLPDGQKLPQVKPENRQLGRVLKYGNDSRMFGFYFGSMGNSLPLDFFKAINPYFLGVGQKIYDLAIERGSGKKALDSLTENEIFPTVGRAAGIVLLLNRQGIEDEDLRNRRLKNNLRLLD